jgi:IS5 family transposase
MRQDSFPDVGFETYRKKARKEQFLEEMEMIIPWKELTEAFEPFYPKPQGAGRRAQAYRNRTYVANPLHPALV